MNTSRSPPPPTASHQRCESMWGTFKMLISLIKSFPVLMEDLVMKLLYEREAPRATASIKERHRRAAETSDLWRHRTRRRHDGKITGFRLDLSASVLLFYLHRTLRGSLWEALGGVASGGRGLWRTLCCWCCCLTGRSRPF